MAKGSKSIWTLLVLLIIGSILGSLLGKALENYLPLLNYGQSIGFSPTTIDLAAITVTLGLSINLTLAAILGFFIALFIYSRI